MIKRSNPASEVRSLFGLAVKERRMSLGLSQEELAHRANLHRTYVTDIERGSRNVTLESVSKLAGALEVPLGELFSPPTRGILAAQPYVPFEVGGFKALKANVVDILVVEDDRLHAELTLNALKKNGVTNNISVVETGEDALNFLFGEGKYRTRKFSPKPKLVLLDLKLPKIDGLEVLRRVRSDNRTKSIPVVVLTTSRSEENQRESVKLGITAYVRKPVDFTEFSKVMPTIGFRWMLVK